MGEQLRNFYIQCGYSEKVEGSLDNTLRRRSSPFKLLFDLEPDSEWSDDEMSPSLGKRKMLPELISTSISQDGSESPSQSRLSMANFNNPTNEELRSLALDTMRRIQSGVDNATLSLKDHHTVKTNLNGRNDPHSTILLDNYNEMINFMLCSKSTSDIWTKNRLAKINKKTYDAIFSKDPELFGQAITLKMCPVMKAFLGVKSFKNCNPFKTKSMSGPFLPPNMRCPQISKNKKGMYYINPRDDILLKYIQPNLLNYMTRQFLDSTDQSITQAMRDQFKKYGRIRSQLFKKAFFKFYVGRESSTYIRIVKKKRNCEGYYEQVPGPEHMDLFEVKKSMFTGCLDWLLESSIKLRDTVTAILNSPEFIEFLNNRSLEAIQKIILLTKKCSEYPYSDVQNRFGIQIYKQRFLI